MLIVGRVSVQSARLGIHLWRANDERFKAINLYCDVWGSFFGVQ